MNKQDVIRFFDRMASGWDDDLIRNDAVIQKIMDNAGVTAGVSVLDVACGTGVLFPDYLQRKVASVTAIDISEQMAAIAEKKYPGKIRVICGDVETTPFAEKFDCIVVYNAFPHFPDPQNLIRVLSGLLKSGGTLTVAHGMSRAAIDHHHEGTASKVSMGLMSEEALAEIVAKFLRVNVIISDEQMYQVCGVKE